MSVIQRMSELFSGSDTWGITERRWFTVTFPCWAPSALLDRLLDDIERWDRDPSGDTAAHNIWYLSCIWQYLIDKGYPVPDEVPAFFARRRMGI